MTRWIRFEWATYDGRYNVHPGPVIVLASDDERFARFGPEKLYRGRRDSIRDWEALLSDRTLEAVWAAEALHEEASGTRIAQMAFRVASRELSDEEAVAHRATIEQYDRLAGAVGPAE